MRYKINFKYFRKFKKHADYLIKGIFAGALIAIGGIAYLSVENKVAGSFLFSLGLLTVCMYGMNLYTGKIGYVLINKLDYLYELFIGLLGNFIGAFLVGKLVLASRIKSIAEVAKTISFIKLNDSLVSIFILSMFCGMIIYIAVNNYKKASNEIGKYIGIIMGIMVFILCGFEHCVANMFYFTVAGAWSLRTLLYVLIMVLGNSVGSIVIAWFYNLYYKN